MASLNPGSVNYDGGVYINAPSDVRYWTSEMHNKKIEPDIAIFDVGMVNNSMLLANEGLIIEPYVFTFVLGQVGAIPATAKNLLFFRKRCPIIRYAFLQGIAGVILTCQP